MSRKIIERVNPEQSFGFTFRRGTPAVPSVTVEATKAARLNLSGKVDPKTGAITTKARDARPRAVVLSNAKALTASNPAGTVPAGGVAISAPTWSEVIERHGWTTIGAMFPADGSDPTPEARAALDPVEVEAMTDYLRNLETLDDIEDASSVATL